MDMSLREWLILIGAVILIGILLDGYRRMLRAKKDSLEISQRMGGTYDSTPLEEDFNPELPVGRARVVKRDDDVSDLAQASDSEEADLRGEREEPDFGWDDDDLVAVREQVSGASATAASPQKDPQGVPRFPEAVIVTEEAAPQDTAAKVVAEPRETARPPKTEPVAPPATASSGAASNGGRLVQRRNKVEPNPKSTGPKPPQEIIIINVLCRDEEGFNGLQLRRLIEACGLEYGEMSVFNRHEHGFGQGPVQFGMANLVDPGTFDLAAMDESRFPGVCFFLTLPGPEDTMKAFEYMLETAQCVVRNLHGEMKDERRSVFTQQTIEHCRQRVREFERRQQLAARV